MGKDFHHVALTKILGEEIWLAFTNSGVCASEFKKLTSLSQFRNHLQERTGETFSKVVSMPENMEKAIRQWEIHGYSSDLNFDISSFSLFQQKVWNRCSQIPLGETSTYSEIAISINHPKAQRAVGSALGANPVPVLIPCHRVLRNDGGLGGYAYGSRLKELLLARENYAKVLD